MIDLGDLVGDETIVIPFQTFGGSNESITITGLAVTDIEVYKGSSMTQRASDSGYSLVDTDGIDIDGITGIHAISIDLSDNTDAGFYSTGSDYFVVVSAITVNSQTVSFIAGRFSIQNRFPYTYATTVPSIGIIESGTAQSATATTLVLRAATVNGSINSGATLLVYGSTQGYWQPVIVDSFSGDTATITAWPVTTPSGTITYIVLGTPSASTGSPIPVNATQIAGSATAATNASSCFTGTITTLDALDTAQDTQHSTTQSAIATAQADLDTITGSDGVTLATTQGNYAPATAAALATVDGNVDIMVLGIITGTAQTGTLSTTQATTDLTGYADDQIIGRILTWTGGACEGEQTDITDYASASGLITFTALTTAPSNTDPFKIT